MPLSYLTRPPMLPRDTRLKNCCSVGSATYRVYQKRDFPKPSTHDNYIKELQSIYQTAKFNLRSQKERSKEYLDVNMPLFSVGVLLHDEKVRRWRSDKLSPPWIGPCEIIDIDDVNITLKLPRNKTQSSRQEAETILWLIAGP